MQIEEHRKRSENVIVELIKCLIPTLETKRKCQQRARHTALLRRQNHELGKILHRHHKLATGFSFNSENKSAPHQFRDLLTTNLTSGNPPLPQTAEIAGHYKYATNKQMNREATRQTKTGQMPRK